MPYNRKLYHAEWEAIALEIKTRAMWVCQECQRPCKKPTESWDELKYRLAKKSKALYDECCEKKGRFILTCAHLNHTPSDNTTANLRALCAPCHLRYDAKLHAKNAAITRAAKAVKKKTAKKGVK